MSTNHLLTPFSIIIITTAQETGLLYFCFSSQYYRTVFFVKSYKAGFFFRAPRGEEGWPAIFLWVCIGWLMTKALEFRLRPVHASLKENPIRWNMQLGWAVMLVVTVPSRRPYFYINSFKIILNELK